MSLPPTQNNLEDAKGNRHAGEGEKAQEEGTGAVQGAVVKLCPLVARKENFRRLHQKQLTLPLQQRSLKEPPLLDHHLQQSLQLLQLLLETQHQKVSAQ